MLAVILYTTDALPCVAVALEPGDELLDQRVRELSTHGREFAEVELEGSMAASALELYDIAVDHLFAHPSSEPLLSTVYGRAYLDTMGALRTLARDCL